MDGMKLSRGRGERQPLNSRDAEEEDGEGSYEEDDWDGSDDEWDRCTVSPFVGKAACVGALLTIWILIWWVFIAPALQPEGKAKGTSSSASTRDSSSPEVPSLRVPPVPLKELEPERGAKCVSACGGAGACDDFCGVGKACCRYGATEDPPICRSVVQEEWGDLEHYTCVKPSAQVSAPPDHVSNGQVVLNWGLDCWRDCQQRSGYCTYFCGAGNACCKWGAVGDAPECQGIMEFGSKDAYTCVAPTNPTYQIALKPSENSVNVKHWGQPCFPHCNKSGYCSEFCGIGNACCLWNDGLQAGECAGVTEFGSKEFHTCVAPTALEYKVSEMSEGVLHWGENCSGSCGGPGYCQEFCGVGGACCRWRSQTDPPECGGVIQFGAKDRHTCVRPVNPFYVEVLVPSGPVWNWSADCWPQCHKAGLCQGFCGPGNACCRFGATSDPPECRGITAWGSKDRYTCVAPTDATFHVFDKPAAGTDVKHWGEGCLEACNNHGGACPSFCGRGNACCKFGSPFDPPECHGIIQWGSKEMHTCVAPVNRAVYVNHFAEDCWWDCNGAGYCEDWCGKGNACCKYMSAEDPAECKGVGYFPTTIRHTCVKAAGLPGSNIPVAPVFGACRPGQTPALFGKCEDAKTSAFMTFYLYLPTNRVNPMLKNAHLSNLAGVLWYLHHDVVTHCPRSQWFDRIVRYVVTVKNPLKFYNATHRQFGSLEGQTPSDRPNGMVVGCQEHATAAEEYPLYPEPTVFSLPGGLYAGGECAAPDGTDNCTWRAYYAGEVKLDELSGIADDFLFCRNSQVEYNATTDVGKGTSFWNFRRNMSWSLHRMQFVKELFETKYPSYPADIGEPRCDSSSSMASA